jgi:hypothetical protein
MAQWPNLGVLDLLAAGDGVTDDSGAINTATAAIVAAGGGILNIPSGTFKIASNVTIPTNVTLNFLEGGQILIPTGIVLTISGSIVASPQQQIFTFNLPQNITTDPAPVHMGVWTTSLSTSQTTPMTVSPYWWGAKADGTTDCYIPVQQCINAFGWSGGATAYLGLGGTIQFGNGIHKLTKGLIFGAGACGLRFYGVSWGGGGGTGTAFQFYQTDATPGFFIGADPVGSGGATSNCVDFEMGYLSALMVNTGGGPVLKTGRCGQSHIHHCNFDQYAISKNICEFIGQASPPYYAQQITLEHTVLSLAQKYAGSAIYISTVNGYDVSEMYFNDLLINGQPNGVNQGTVPHVYINEGGSTVNCANIQFNGIRHEESVAGAYALYGGRSITLNHCMMGIDQSAVGTAPQILIGKGTGGGNALPIGLVVTGCEIYFGGNTQATAAVAFNAQFAGMDSPTFISCALGYVWSGTFGVGQTLTLINCEWQQITGSMAPLHVGGLFTTGIVQLCGQLTSYGGNNHAGFVQIPSGTSQGVASQGNGNWNYGAEPDPNYVLTFGPAIPANTTIAALSDGKVLPQATINVASTVGFPASGTIRVYIQASGQLVTVNYTGTNATQFTGCTGGSQTLVLGAVVYGPVITAGQQRVLDVCPTLVGFIITMEQAATQTLTIPYHVVRR